MDETETVTCRLTTHDCRRDCKQRLTRLKTRCKCIHKSHIYSCTLLTLVILAFSQEEAFGLRPQRIQNTEAAGRSRRQVAVAELAGPAAGNARNLREIEEEATVDPMSAPTSGPEPQIGNQLGAGDTKLHIVRVLAPEAVQNATQNVTIDCMFKFDRKLDQRLTIKWFFNDEVEPIYQWIPELNKRVYSDKYERFLDKSYEVSEDVDYMLHAYRWLEKQEQADGSLDYSLADNDEQASRRLLAGRLSKLAKLGGRQSRQLIDSLRSVLRMDRLEFSRYRALRLVRPTLELGGRFSCSVTSLDGDDFRTTKLVVYEPAKNFTFNVSRTVANGQLQYNITCQADRVFPRPSLALYRYRAGPLDSPPDKPQRRPKLAATLLRQELLASSTQVTLMGQHQRNKWPGEPTLEPVGDKSTSANDIRSNQEDANEPQSEQPLYEIVSWALVDESSLSTNVVSQFECLLSIDGTDYERRQSLALQRGWHVNAAALESRHALVGLFGALASLLCLVLALVSSMLIFKLLRRSHAKNRRVHHQQPDNKPDNNARYARGADPSSTTLSAAVATIATSSNYPASQQSANSPQVSTTSQTITSSDSPESVDHSQMPTQILTKRPSLDDESEADGVYRVPASEAKFGTRYFVEPPGSRLYYGPVASSVALTNSYKQQVAHEGGSSFGNATLSHNKQPNSQPILSHHEYISSSSKPLYC